MMNTLQKISAARDLEVFTRTGWLAEVPAAFREALLARCDLQDVAAGEALYHLGDAAGGLYGIVRGQAGIHGAPSRSGESLFHIVGPGFWTGEFSAVTGQGRVISLVARTPGQVARLPRAELQRLAAADPETWRHVSVMIVQNTGRAMQVIAALRRDSGVERLAATLVNLAAEVPDRPPVIRVSQDELGALARLSRGSVNAGLARLEAAGLVRRDYGTITLPDVAALAGFGTQT